MLLQEGAVCAQCWPTAGSTWTSCWSWGRSWGRRPWCWPAPTPPGSPPGTGTGGTLTSSHEQCCGSGIRCLWIQDPGWVKNQDPDPGSYFRKLRKTFWVKILKFFDADLDPGSGIVLTLYLGWKKSEILLRIWILNPGSWIRDPVLCWPLDSGSVFGIGKNPDLGSEIWDLG